MDNNEIVNEGLTFKEIFACLILNFKKMSHKSLIISIILTLIILVGLIVNCFFAGRELTKYNNELTKAEDQLNSFQNYYNGSILYNLNFSQCYKGTIALTVFIPGEKANDSAYYNSLLSAYAQPFADESIYASIDANDMNSKLKNKINDIPLLSQVLRYKVDYDSKVLTIKIWHYSKEDLQVIMDEIIKSINSYNSKFIPEMGDHKCVILNNSIIITSDSTLSQQQNSVKNILANYQGQKDSLNKKIYFIKLSSSLFGMIIISIIVFLGLFLLALIILSISYAIKLNSGSKVISSKQLRRIYEWNVLGEFTYFENKNSRLYRWISKTLSDFYNVDEECMFKIINDSLKYENDDSIIFICDSCNKEDIELIQKIKSKPKAVIYDEINYNIDSLKEIIDSNKVIFVAKHFKTSVEKINEQELILNKHEKSMDGIIVL